MFARRAPLAFAAFAIAIAVDARAEEPTPPMHGNVEASFGYAAVNGSNDPPNLYGFGTGLRAGVTFGTGFYAGGIVIAHAGASSDAIPKSGTGLARVARTMIGVEAGYEWETPILFRVYSGVGGLLDRGANRNATGAFVPLATTSDFGMWPGAAVRVPIPGARHLVIGADLHLTLPAAADAPVGFEISALFGTRFATPW